MNEQEKLAYFISMCKGCTLAEAMKTCPQCQFNIGLAVPVELPLPEAVSIPLQTIASSLTVAG